MEKTFYVVLADSTGKLSSEVFASRPGIVTVTKVDDIVDDVVARVVLTDAFGPTDYVVRVVHKPMGKVMRTETVTLAGKTPDWAAFADAWRDWVKNPEVLSSAEQFVRAHVTGTDQQKVDSLFQSAGRANARLHERKDAWSEVAKLCGINPADIAGTGSRTASVAMVIRIAQKLSKGKPASEQWVSPLPRPQYIDPAQVKRVQVAGKAVEKTA